MFYREGMKKALKDLLADRIDTAYGGSQAAFARATGFTPQTVNTWLKGKVTLPQIEARRRLAQELGLSHLELLVVMGELSEDEIDLPVDPRSAAVRFFQPRIDAIQWTPRVRQQVADYLDFIRDAQRGTLDGPRMLTEMEDTDGIRVTEFGDEGKI